MNPKFLRVMGYSSAAVPFVMLGYFAAKEHRAEKQRQRREAEEMARRLRELADKLRAFFDAVHAVQEEAVKQMEEDADQSWFDWKFGEMTNDL